jgi:hypothetical protein
MKIRVENHLPNKKPAKVFAGYEQRISSKVI